MAFKIIRKRDFPKFRKVHQIIRSLPKWLENENAKEDLYELLDIELTLEDEEVKDKEGNEYSEREKDLIWGKKHENSIIGAVKRAHDIYEEDKQRETPLTLLEDAKKKLEHRDMDPKALREKDLSQAMKLAAEIQKIANTLEGKFYREEKRR